MIRTRRKEMERIGQWSKEMPDRAVKKRHMRRGGVLFAAI